MMHAVIELRGQLRDVVLQARAIEAKAWSEYRELNGEEMRRFDASMREADDLAKQLRSLRAEAEFDDTAANEELQRWWRAREAGMEAVEAFVEGPRPRFAAGASLSETQRRGS